MSEDAPILTAIIDGDLDSLAALVNSGEVINKRYKSRSMGVDTPLCCAVRKRQLSMVAWLLKRGADPNFPWYRDGEPPLVTAAGARSSDIVKLLLEHGADPRPKKFSPVVAAVRTNDVHAMELLLARGADATEISQLKVLEMVRVKGPILRMLINAGAKLPPDIENLALSFGALDDTGGGDSYRR